MEEAKVRPFSGTVLQLGRSSVYFAQPELERWARADGFALRPGVEISRSHDPRLAAQGCLSDTSFFRQLGFDRVESCDIADWEGADHLFDLNGTVPSELEGRFDVVFETGTIVQIFDLPRVLANLHRLVRPGGRIIHCAVPSNNHMDLGFYMLCPTFFADHYAANGYRVESHQLCEYFAYWLDGRLCSDAWRVYDYRPGMLDGLSYGRYGGAQAATFVVATKVAGSTGDRVAALGQYRQSWQEFAAQRGEAIAAGAKAADRSDGVLERLARRGGVAARLAVATKRVAEGVRRRLLPRRMPAPRRRV
jgi:SAM-dependent methyltransferase